MVTIQNQHIKESISFPNKWEELNPKQYLFAMIFKPRVYIQYYLLFIKGKVVDMKNKKI